MRRSVEESLRKKLRARSLNHALCESQFARCQLVAEHWLFGFDFDLRRGSDKAADGNESAFGSSLFEDLLAIESSHSRVLRVLFQLSVAGANLFFARVLGDAELVERRVGMRV